MKGQVRLLLVGLMVLVSGAAGLGTEMRLPARDYFEIVDLQLVSYAGVPGGTPDYSGPVSTAIVLAWYAEHGFRALLEDLNRDGVIDERDTELLAEELAAAMEVGPGQPASDPQLVDALARYVAERYPHKFLVRIYDDTFEGEYRQVFGKEFNPADYPGIEFELCAIATHQDYTRELQSARPVIAGVGPEGGTNTYFVGRSFGTEEYYEEWPVDFVDTSPDPFEPEVQGQVLHTFMREGRTHWFVAYAGWQPLEFMLALQRVHLPVLGEPGPCPPGAIGYHLDEVDTEYGRFTVEECVVREGDHDRYVYTITNIDYLYSDCGLCNFYLPNFHGHPTLDQWGPEGWLINPWVVEWHWVAPLGSCGIPPGQAAEMGLVVPGPTVDEYQDASALPCPFYVGEDMVLPIMLPQHLFHTTGPGYKDPDPDPDPDCVCSIRPTSEHFSASGGFVAVWVTIDAGCAWTVINPCPWITPIPMSGTGDGTVHVHVSANTGVARSCTLTICGQPFQVTQDGVALCIYSLSHYEEWVDAQGTNFQMGGTVEVYTQPGCRWTASSPCGWVTVSPSSGTGSGTVTLRVDPNYGSARSCTLTIAGRTFTVHQAGYGK